MSFSIHFNDDGSITWSGTSNEVGQPTDPTPSDPTEPPPIPPTPTDPTPLDFSHLPFDVQWIKRFIPKGEKAPLWSCYKKNSGKVDANDAGYLTMDYKFGTFMNPNHKTEGREIWVPIGATFSVGIGAATNSLATRGVDVYVTTNRHGLIRANGSRYFFPVMQIAYPNGDLYPFNVGKPNLIGNQVHFVSIGDTVEGRALQVEHPSWK